MLFRPKLVVLFAMAYVIAGYYWRFDSERNTDIGGARANFL